MCPYHTTLRKEKRPCNECFRVCVGVWVLQHEVTDAIVTNLSFTHKSVYLIPEFFFSVVFFLFFFCVFHFHLFFFLFLVVFPRSPSSLLLLGTVVSVDYFLIS